MSSIFSGNSAVKSPGKGSGFVLMVGSFPPPISGQALVLACIAEALRGQVQTQCVDVSTDGAPRGLSHLSARVRQAGAVLRTVAANAFRPEKRLYVALDGGKGLLFSTPILLLARLLRYRLFLQHHSYAHCHQPVRRMRRLLAAAGSNACYIFPTEPMRKRFTELYGSVGNSLIATKARFVDRPGLTGPPASGDLRLGHLGNLSVEKGLAEAVETTRELLSRGRRVRLLLAGPCRDEATQALLAEARETLGPALDYRGAVYGADKTEFYREIDVFLFPTRDDNEMEPLVLYEALAQGVPCIAYGRGCIAAQIGAGAGGLLVPRDEDFVTLAANQLEAWIIRPGTLSAAKARALAHGRACRALGEQHFRDLMTRLGVEAAAMGEAGPRQGEKSRAA